jgi:hypothetical protein
VTSPLIPEDRNLLALVAVFAPARAVRLLARLGVPDADPLRAEGVRIAAASRRTRLLAFSESVAGARLAEHAEPLASVGRPRGRRADSACPRSDAFSAPSRRHEA